MEQSASDLVGQGEDADQFENVELRRLDSRDVTNTRTTYLQPNPKGNTKAEGTSSPFLSPHLVPIRPYSPDTLSILSADEYEQLSSSPSTHNKPDPTQPTHTGIRGRLQRSWVRNKGLFLMLLAQFFGSLMNITTRLLETTGSRMGPFPILFARMSMTAVLASAYMWWKSTPHFPFGAPEVRSLLVARGFMGFFGVFGMYYSLLYLPLADATVITFLAPALACWACSFLIKEPFTRTEQIAALISLVGVVLIARPTSLFAAAASVGDSVPSTSGTGDAVVGVGAGTGNSTTSSVPSVNGTAMNNSAFNSTNAGVGSDSLHAVTPMQRLTAVGVALLGVLGSAGAYTTVRWIGKRAHPLVSVNYFAVWTTVVSLVAIIAVPDVHFELPNGLTEWGYLLFLGICGFTMQFLLAAGLSYEKSSRATNMAYSQMLFALAGDKLVFGHTPGVMSIIGSSLILGSAVVVAVQRDPNRNGPNDRANAEERNGTSPAGPSSADDEESQRRLMDGEDAETGEDREMLGIDEVQMRTLR